MKDTEIRLPTDAPVSYDMERDLFTIYGVQYAGELFRTLGFAPVGCWLRIEGRAEGTLTVYRASETTARFFDAMVGRGPPIQL